MKVWEIDKVIDIVGEKDDYRCCSICAQYKKKESFGDVVDNKFVQTRTNCFECYNIGGSNWIAIREDVNKRSVAAKKAKEDFDNKQKMIDNSISVADMIAALQKLPADAKILITESGYYSSSPYAEIFLPEKVQDNIYKIGHSEQSH